MFYISLNQTSRGVFPHGDLSMKGFMHGKLSRAGQGSALQQQFDWIKQQRGWTELSPIKTDTQLPTGESRAA